MKGGFRFHVVWDRFQPEAVGDLERAQMRYVKELEELEKDVAKWREEESVKTVDDGNAPKT